MRLNSFVFTSGCSFRAKWKPWKRSLPGSNTFHHPILTEEWLSTVLPGSQKGRGKRQILPARVARFEMPTHPSPGRDYINTQPLSKAFILHHALIFSQENKDKNDEAAEYSSHFVTNNEAGGYGLGLPFLPACLPSAPSRARHFPRAGRSAASRRGSAAALRWRPRGSGSSSGGGSGRRGGCAAPNRRRVPVPWGRAAAGGWPEAATAEGAVTAQRGAPPRGPRPAPPGMWRWVRQQLVGAGGP